MSDKLIEVENTQCPVCGYSYNELTALRAEVERLKWAVKDRDALKQDYDRLVGLFMELKGQWAVIQELLLRRHS